MSWGGWMILQEEQKNSWADEPQLQHFLTDEPEHNHRAEFRVTRAFASLTWNASVRTNRSGFPGARHKATGLQMFCRFGKHLWAAHNIRTHRMILQSQQHPPGTLNGQHLLHQVTSLPGYHCACVVASATFFLAAIKS